MSNVDARPIFIVPFFFMLNDVYASLLFSSFACGTVSWSTEDMSGMPGWSQDRIACTGWKFKRHHTATSQGKSEESRKTVVSLLPRYFGVPFCAQDSEPFSLVFRVLLHREGLIESCRCRVQDLFSSLLFSSRLVSSLLFVSLLFSSLTLPHLCFSSVHVVGNLTSELPR